MIELLATIDPSQDQVLRWAAWAVIAAAGIAAMVISWLLLFRRRRLLEPSSKWLLLIGLGLLPAFVLAGSNSVILSRSKTVDSCGTCHMMKPFIDDLRDSKSDTLAAIHYKNRYIPENQCYVCHSGYGIFGDAAAKKRGVGHLIKYWTGHYERPIRHEGPFPVDQCLKCHGESARFRAVEAHQGDDFMSDLRTGKSGCIDCHGRSHPDFGKR